LRVRKQIFHFSLITYHLFSYLCIEMKTILLFMMTAVLLLSCANRREEQKQQLRQEVRSQYYDRQLQEAERQLAKTDSLLQMAEADSSAVDVEKHLRLDSLRHAADVQGAKIRYIHKKQKDL